MLRLKIEKWLFPKKLPAMRADGKIVYASRIERLKRFLLVNYSTWLGKREQTKIATWEHQAVRQCVMAKAKSGMITTATYKGPDGEVLSYQYRDITKMPRAYQSPRSQHTFV